MNDQPGQKCPGIEGIIMHTFRVVIRDVQYIGQQQTTADVVRNDGRVVCSGMWPDYAAASCALLNEYCENGWTTAQYHVMRKLRMAAVRK